MECFTSGDDPNDIYWIVNDEEIPNMNFKEDEIDEINNTLTLSLIQHGESINVTCAVNVSEENVYQTVVLEGKVYGNHNHHV